MANINWKTGKPVEDGVYLTTLGYEGDVPRVVFTILEDGAWLTSGEVKAWDFRPDPYDPNEDYESSGHYADDYVKSLEFQVKDLEASWTEVHGEMKYYEGATEALMNVIEAVAKGAQ